MHRQKRAFLNVTKKGERRSDKEDRIACAKRFEEYAKKAQKGEVEVKGKRIGLNDFTKEAFGLIGKSDSSEAAILNAQWLDNSKQTGALGKMVAMVDVSGSMTGDPMNAAIALGIRVAEKSMLGKRVMTFSASPTWVNLQDKDTFIDMVETIQRADWGMNTNFAAALKMILDAIISRKLKPEDVEDMVLAIFSDMQIDAADPSSTSMMDSIEKMYAEAGNRLWGKPFKAPHILFWNLRSTSGFPTLSTQRNASMMSGFSPALLNLFCEEGLEALQSCTPWSLLVKSLKNERYKPMDAFIRSELSTNI
jgi:Mg-chelatase subunit ChlD